MKRAFSILLLFFLTLATKAALTVTNGDVVTFNNSSYSIPFRLAGVPFLAFWPSMYPGITNEFGDLSRPGEGWPGWYQSEEEKWGLAIWASHTNLHAQVKLFYPGDDNGGLNTNTQVQWGTNIANAPQSFYNGTAATNEGYNFPIDFEFPGAYPHDSADGDSGEIDRNAGCMGLQAFYGHPVVDLWHDTWTNGWSADVVGSRVLGFSTGSHPYHGGFVSGAISMLTQLGADTNVGTLTIDGSAFTAVTNHFTCSAVTNTGSGVSLVVHADRMPLGWIEQAGTITNQGSMAFKAEPSLATRFTWKIIGTNFPNGTYTLTDGATVISTATTAGGNLSFNLFTNMNGAWWNQRTAVVNKFLDFYGVDHTTLIPHSAGSQGVLGVGDLVNYISNANGFYDGSGQRGATFVASMATSVANLEQYDAAIYGPAQQTNHLLAITLTQTANVTNLTVGTLHFGQVTTQRIWFMDGTNWPDDEWTNAFAFLGAVTTTNLATPLAKWQLVPAALEVCQGHLAFALISAEPQLFCKAVFQPKTP